MARGISESLTSEAMATINLVQRLIREKVDSYEDEYDLWKADHKLAMLYFDFCDLLRDGLELYRDICRLDENWRRMVYRDEIPYDPDMAAKIAELFPRLGRMLFSIESDLLPFFAKNYGVEDGEEFGKYCNELRGVLTKDSHFFDHDALIKLRDDAVDEYARGECEQWTA